MSKNEGLFDAIRAMLKRRLDIEPGDVIVQRTMLGNVEVRARRAGAPVCAEVSARALAQNMAGALDKLGDDIAHLLGIAPRSDDSGVRAVEREALVAGGNDVQAEVLRDLVREAARRRAIPSNGMAPKLEDTLLRIMRAGGDIGEAIADGDADDLYTALVTMGAHMVDWCEALRRYGEGKRKGAAEVIA
jgi:hypothetical protein